MICVLYGSMAAAEISLFHGLSAGKIVMFSAAVFDAVQVTIIGGPEPPGGLPPSSVSALFFTAV